MKNTIQGESFTQDEFTCIYLVMAQHSTADQGLNHIFTRKQRQAAQSALQKLRQILISLGIDRVTLDEIEAEL